MQLTYRGQAYTTSNAPSTVNPQATFTYRGQSYHRQQSAFSVTPKAKLVYRGIPLMGAESSVYGTTTPAFS